MSLSRTCVGHVSVLKVSRGAETLMSLSRRQKFIGTLGRAGAKNGDEMFFSG